MTIDEMIAVLQAAKDGKRIQARGCPDGTWHDVTDDWRGPFLCEYRIKPEPVEAWTNVYPDGKMGGFYYTEQQAKLLAGNNTARQVLMREVLP